MSSLRSLQAFAAPKRTDELCELCAQAVSPRHQHLIDPSTRKLVCTCDGCAVLFDSQGTTKYRRIPRNIKALDGFRLQDEAWTSLLVPISLAFFYRSSHAKRVVALYPSPAGVTESLIEPVPWERISEANPELKDLQEDVQALLVNRIKERREYFIAPIDRCFELVGLVRTRWRGFSGGDRVWADVGAFLSQLRREAVS
jgi:hypothetical protein